MIFRYNFDTNFTEKLGSFAKIYQYSDRHEFKEKWEEWVQENQEDIITETRRLESIGYKGDVPTKMFKSARYYFRTKESSEPKPRRVYVTTDKEMLGIIDEFLRNEMLNPEFTPRASYEKFQQDHDVPKKTFKNRYFLAKKK